MCLMLKVINLNDVLEKNADFTHKNTKLLLTHKAMKILSECSTADMKKN